MAVTGRPTGVANTGDSSVLAVRVLEDAVLQEAPPKQAAPTEGGWLGVLGGCSRGGRVGGASPCGVGTEPRACTPASVAAPMAASRPVLLATWSDAWPCGGKRGGGVSWWRAHEFGLVEWHLRVSVSTRAKQGSGGTFSVGCRLTVEPDRQVKPGYRGTTGRRGQEEACGRRGEGQQGAAEPAEETKAPWTRRARCARTASCAASCATPAASSPARSSPRACCCPEGALPARGRRRPPARSARAAAPRARRARHLPGARQARLSGGARPRVQEATRAHCRRQKSCRMEWQPRWLRA